MADEGLVALRGALDKILAAEHAVRFLAGIAPIDRLVENRSFAIHMVGTLVRG
jgi:hypothetical protein